MFTSKNLAIGGIVLVLLVGGYLVMQHSSTTDSSVSTVNQGMSGAAAAGQTDFQAAMGGLTGVLNFTQHIYDDQAAAQRARQQSQTSASH